MMLMAFLTVNRGLFRAMCDRGVTTSEDHRRVRARVLLSLVVSMSAVVGCDRSPPRTRSDRASADVTSPDSEPQVLPATKGSKLASSSTAMPAITDKTVVVIGSSAITVNGEEIVRHEKGALDPSVLHDGPRGYWIRPLVETFINAAARERPPDTHPRNFEWRITVKPQASTPYRLLNAVLYSASIASRTEYQLVVADRDGVERSLTSCVTSDGGWSGSYDFWFSTTCQPPFRRNDNPTKAPISVFVGNEGFRLQRIPYDPERPAGDSRYGRAEEEEIPLRSDAGEACPEPDRITLSKIGVNPPACAYDLDALRRKLRTLRGEAGAGEEFRISAQDGIEWQVVVRVIDAVRGLATNPSEYPRFLFAVWPGVERPPRGLADYALPIGRTLDGIEVGPTASNSRPVGAKMKRGRPVFVGGKGTLSVEDVKLIVGRDVVGIKACYAESLRVNPTLSGRMVLRFGVDSRGRVENARSVANEVHPQVGSCVAKRFEALRFPRPKGGRVEISYPFLFVPVFEEESDP